MPAAREHVCICVSIGHHHIAQNINEIDLRVTALRGDTHSTKRCSQSNTVKKKTTEIKISPECAIQKDDK